MRDCRYLLLALLLGTLTLTCCARRSEPIDTRQPALIHPGMTEAEVVQRLGPPVLITEQPSTYVQVPTPTGIEFREKRRYTYYYLGPSQDPDTLITLEDGVVINTGKGTRWGLAYILYPLAAAERGPRHRDTALEAEASWLRVHWPWPLVHGDGASVQGHWGVQVAGSGLAGALLQVRLDLPDRVIEVIDQEIEERCQTAGLHFGDDLECCLAPVKLINNLHARHMPLLQMVGRMRTLLCMATDLVTRIYRQLGGRNISWLF